MDQETLNLIQALTVIVGPIVTALVKYFLPSVPKLARPIIAVAATAVAAGVGADASAGVALGLGVASLGVRDLADRALIAVGARPEKKRKAA